MNKVLIAILSTLAVGYTPFLTGCASSERTVARQIDFTPEIIRQSSDLLAADPDLSRFGIRVDGFKGDMWLRGQVQTPTQRARAEKIVWAVTGVRSVKNEIKLAPANETAKTKP
jgi:osmotically-inducible protein OsmY